MERLEWAPLPRTTLSYMIYHVGRFPGAARLSAPQNTGLDREWMQVVHPAAAARASLQLLNGAELRPNMWIRNTGAPHP